MATVEWLPSVLLSSRANKNTSILFWGHMTFFVYINIQVYASTCKGVGVCICMCGTQKINLRWSTPCVLRQGLSHWDLKLTKLAFKAGQGALGALCLSSPGSGVTRASQYSWLFLWWLDIELRSQSLCMGHLPGHLQSLQLYGCRVAEEWGSCL